MSNNTKRIQKLQDNDISPTVTSEFIDSIRFMASSLSNAVTNLAYSGKISKFSVILWKGVYPSEYMDSWQRFNEISLPTNKKIYGNLTK